MLTFIFAILLIAVFGKLIVFAIKAAWGITKVLFTIVFLPMILIGMVLGGLISIALPMLVIVGIIILIGTKA